MNPVLVSKYYAVLNKVYHKLKIIKPEKKDNFTTYPYHQFALGVELFAQVIRNFINETLQEKSAPKGTSKLWYHPTLGQYLYYRLLKGVK